MLVGRGGAGECGRGGGAAEGLDTEGLDARDGTFCYFILALVTACSMVPNPLCAFVVATLTR